MSKLSSMFFDKEPEQITPVPRAVTSSTPPPAAPVDVDLSRYFILAPSTSTTAPPTAQNNTTHVAAGIPYGSLHQESWSEIEELDPAEITPCPKCHSLEFWEDVAGNTYCMRCQPLKIQCLRNWMNRREMLLNIHAQQREADERAQRASALAAGTDRDGFDDTAAGDPDA